MAVGQEGPLPLHTPACVPLPPVHEGGLQIELRSYRSAGQFGFVPSHASARSQTPAEGRHDAPAWPAGKIHPVFTSQASWVQGLPSSHTGLAPPRHEPPEQRSAMEQALPSSHTTVLFVKTHPVAALQESSVQTLLSLHTMGAPEQAPAVQWSEPVQALPSVQALALLFVKTHPVAGLQESSVQLLPSLQGSAGPPVQTVAAHTSFVVHLLPSLQGAVFAVCAQPPAGVQESSVQGFPSSQFVGPVDTQAPAEQ